jgi:hypothetical protein
MRRNPPEPKILDACKGRPLMRDPYLTPGRLPDVIAAITALGTYRYYKLSFEACAERIPNRPDEAERWGEILGEHPEFFRVNKQANTASLVWRRQNPKRFDPRRSVEITREEFDALTPQQQAETSRRPLSPSEITALINVAVNLHERALEHQKAARWWIPIVTSAMAFVGALFGTLLAGQSWWHTPA